MMKLRMQLMRSAWMQDIRGRRTYPTKAPASPNISPSKEGTAEWLVIIPDHHGVLEKRMEVRK